MDAHDDAIMDSKADVLNDRVQLRSEPEIDRVFKDLDEQGIHILIKDGLKDDCKLWLTEDDSDNPEEDKLRQGGGLASEEDATSDEQPKLPGQRHPQRGEGWCRQTLTTAEERPQQGPRAGAGNPPLGRWRI